MQYNYVILQKLLISISLIILFYNYIKYLIFFISGKVAVYFGLVRYYNYETVKGFVELPIVVLSHFLFCYGLIKLLHIKFTDIHFVSFSSLILCLEGVLLGIGIMGFSALLGRLYIEIVRYFSSDRSPNSIKNWLTVARGGWIRHHFHTLEILPVPLALLITLGQVCAEEVVFRGVFIQYFMPFGEMISLVISTSLFMYMQTFHMQSRVSSVFPMIGALTMGSIGGFLYLKTHVLLPLIIAHITFFIFSVL